MAIITVIITTKEDVLPASLVSESKNLVHHAFRLYYQSAGSKTAAGTKCSIELEKRNSAGDVLNVTVSPNL